MPPDCRDTPPIHFHQGRSINNTQAHRVAIGGSLCGGSRSRRQQCQPGAGDEALSARSRVLLQHTLARLGRGGVRRWATRGCIGRGHAPPCRSSGTPGSEARPQRSARPPRQPSVPAPQPPAPAGQRRPRVSDAASRSLCSGSTRTRLLHARRHLRLPRLVVHARLGRLAPLCEATLACA